MTCIAAYAEQDRGVALAADSGAVGDSLSRHAHTDKLVVKEVGFDLADGLSKSHVEHEVAFGFTTSWRFGNLLSKRLTGAAVSGGFHTDLEAWVVSALVPKARALLGEAGYLEVKNERERGGMCLVGISDALFQINENFGVCRVDWTCIGAAHEIGTGALGALARGSEQKTPNEMVREAVRVATEYHKDARAPVTDVVVTR